MFGVGTFRSLEASVPRPEIVKPNPKPKADTARMRTLTVRFLPREFAK
jgi:hypothetical protein